jgi:hypothetical protein
MLIHWQEQAHLLYQYEEYHKIQHQEIIINMAQLSSPVRVYPYNGWWLQQRNIFNFMTTSGSPTYIHIKTNIPSNSDSMWMIEAVGYNYGNGNATRSAWGFYVYSNTIYGIGLQNAYGGLGVNGVYKSSDNYVVLRCNQGNYFNGFMLNAYATRGNTTHYNVSVIASVQTDNSGNYY